MIYLAKNTSHSRYHDEALHSTRAYHQRHLSSQHSNLPKQKQNPSTPQLPTKLKDETTHTDKTTMTKDNMVQAQGNHLMLDTIKLAVSITHFCKSKPFKGGCIGECVLFLGYY
jgi:hypothetical protein